MLDQQEHEPRVHHHQCVSWQRIQPHHVDADGRQQAVGVLAELLDLHAFVVHVEAAPQQPAKAAAQLPRKTFVGALQRRHAPAHDTVLAGEVVELDLGRRQLGRGFDLAAAHAVQQRIDLIASDRNIGLIERLVAEAHTETGMTVVWVTHDIFQARRVASKVAFLLGGRLVELADKVELFARPRHPYTRMLLDAIPDIHMSGSARTPVQGEVPNPLNPPSGCAFNPRCSLANDRCRSERPLLHEVAGDRVACHAVEEGRIQA